MPSRFLHLLQSDPEHRVNVYRLRFASPISTPPLPLDWCFELVLDYGDNNAAVRLPEESTGTCVLRTDPFHPDAPVSRCAAVVFAGAVFHHFPRPPTVGRD